jgi:hypothetical protein
LTNKPINQLIQSTKQHVRAHGNQLTPVCFAGFIVAESTIRWFVVREKHHWMVVDSAE